jgi:2-hydroxycyclohexanecarboxyl-CoA dehydrogenase
VSDRCSPGRPAASQQPQHGGAGVSLQPVSEHGGQAGEQARTPEQDAGRVALVGIGRATAQRLAAAGMTIAAADVDVLALEEVAAPETILAFAVDVASQQSVQALAEQVTAECGVPDVIVNCAGWDQTHRFTDTDRAFWERVVAINLLGVVAVTHAFLAAMIAGGRGGRIVNVGSDAGRVGSSGEAVYAGAKGGVIAFTKSLAREAARHAITANVVCPGPTDTPLFRAQPERLQQALERAVPMGRLGLPGDVAAAIAFFASADASYVTGQVLSVSGGLTMAG